MPWYIRNIPFGLGPIAGFFLLGSSLPFVTQLGDLWGAILAGLIVLGGIGSLLLALRWMRFPPRVLKPGWLVEAERDRPPPEDAIAALRLIDRVFIGLLVVGGLAVAGALVVLFIAGVVRGFFG